MNPPRLVTADVAIVGGGMIGLCVADALARHGAGKIVVLERGACGQGATSKATGGIRCQFGSEINVRLSLMSLPYFERWKEIFGGDCLLRKVGYVFLATSPVHQKTQAAAVELQRSLGAPVEVLDRNQISELLPYLNLEGVLSATYCPDDGVADPGTAINSLLADCRRLGVEILEEKEVVAVRTDRGRVQALVTTRGDLPAGLIVNAAGPWSGLVARMAGVALPVEPHHRQVYRAGGVRLPVRPSPFVVDLGSGIYYHTEGEDGVIFGGGDRESEAGFDDQVRLEEAPKIIELLTRRVPGMSEAQLTSAWAGLRDMTPDDMALVGSLKELEGFYLACGFSGHGFMHAPAVAELLARKIMGLPLPVEINELSPDRFKGNVQKEAYAF